MLTLIQDDSTLNKEAFSKLVSELETNLQKILVPTGRSYVRFKFCEGKKPSFEDHAAEVDAAEDEMFPALTIKMEADYRINYIPSLYDEWFESHAVKLSRTGQCLMDQQSGSRFCVLASKEIEEKLCELPSFKKNKWMPAASVSLRFENSEKPNAHEYTDFLTVDLVVSVIQG